MFSADEDTGLVCWGALRKDHGLGDLNISVFHSFGGWKPEIEVENLFQVSPLV